MRGSWKPSELRRQGRKKRKMSACSNKDDGRLIKRHEFYILTNQWKIRKTYPKLIQREDKKKCINNLFLLNLVRFVRFHNLKIPSRDGLCKSFGFTIYKFLIIPSDLGLLTAQSNSLFNRLSSPKISPLHSLWVQLNSSLRPWEQRSKVGWV